MNYVFLGVEISNWKIYVIMASESKNSDVSNSYMRKMENICFNREIGWLIRKKKKQPNCTLRLERCKEEIFCRSDNVEYCVSLYMMSPYLKWSLS